MSTHLLAWLFHLSPPKLYSFSSCLSSKFRNCIFHSSFFTMHIQLISKMASQLVRCLQTVPQSFSTWSQSIPSIIETSLGRSPTEQTLHPDTQNICDPTLMSVQLHVLPSFSSPWTLPPDVQFPKFSALSHLWTFAFAFLSAHPSVMSLTAASLGEPLPTLPVWIS